MFIPDFIADHERGWSQRSGEAIVLQSHGMWMQREIGVRHDERETGGPESLSALSALVAPSKHKKTAVEKAVSFAKSASLTTRNYLPTENEISKLF